MPAAWFLVPVVDVPSTGPRAGLTLRRPMAVVNHLLEITEDGGRAEWAETGGNRVVAKVQATATTLQAIAAEDGVRRIPILALDTTLGTLTTAQRTTLRTWVLECGFTADDVNARFPNLAAATLRDLIVWLGTKGHGDVSRIFGRIGDTPPRPR